MQDNSLPSQILDAVQGVSVKYIHFLIVNFSMVILTDGVVRDSPGTLPRERGRVLVKLELQLGKEQGEELLPPLLVG